MKKKKAIIVGGGFAGINAAKKLCHRSDLDILIIDRRNYHLFQPLLYQVATAGLSPADIATPIRSLFGGYKNIQVLLDKVIGIDVTKKQIRCIEHFHNYDYLLLACGANHSYFGHDQWEEHAPGLKTLEQATEIRKKILLAFEMAEKEDDKELQKQLQTFVIVGAGPTGVEMAGSIAEISHDTMDDEFQNINPDHTQVILVEAGPRVLPTFSEKLSNRALHDLQKMEVDVWTNSMVEDITAEGVIFKDRIIKTKTIIWAAGVEPSPLGKSLHVNLDKQGRVFVEKDLSIPMHAEVFVLGDQAHFPTQDGKGLPGLAAVAIQQGRHAAKNIEADLDGKERTEFQYFDKGYMATIGRKSAVVQIKKIQFGGFFAWLAWIFVHIYYLIGFKNRIIVLIQWAWNYITFQRGARLIAEKQWREKPKDSKNQD